MFLSYFTNKSSFHIFMRTFNRFANIIWSSRFLCETHFNMWNHSSELIKYGPNLFNICPLVSLLSEDIDLDLIFSMLSIMFMNFIKCYLVCDGIFSIDSYDPRMSLILFGSWRMDVEFGIVSMTNGIVKYSSSNKLKPILFPEGSNSI